MLIVCTILLLFSFALQLAVDNDEKLWQYTTYIAILVAYLYFGFCEICLENKEKHDYSWNIGLYNIYVVLVMLDYFERLYPREREKIFVDYFQFEYKNT